MVGSSSRPLEELQRQIEDAWGQESQPENLLSSSSLSINDIDLSKNTSQPETTYLDILESWRKLVETMQNELVYLQYERNLQSAFQYLPNKEDFRSIKTLLDLLIQSVRHHAHDACIECRFVTLLEVMLSYNDRWKPSETVEAFWVRLMQRIPANITPLSFRRRAYRVLVSLSWVPSSKGLLEACSFDETAKNTLTAPEKSIQQHIAQIRGGPLPRYDSVNQLLDRLKDETGVCVAISSEKQGMGKTILACLVSHHPSIVRVFTVLWLSVKDENITYELYVDYLSELCIQMKVDKPKFPETTKAFEESALRKLRESRQIEQAKKMMSDVVEGHDNNVLLILDDVSESATIALFRFHDRQSVIVTTNEEDLPDVDWTLELVPMSEEEGIELFLKEAGLSPEHILGSTKELKQIVKSCDLNPLSIRTIARWYQLKQVTAGAKNAVNEILEEIKELESAASPTDNDPNMFLFDILSLLVGPKRNNEGEVMTMLILLCFAAFVVVFPDGAPLDAVLLLWEQILAQEPLAQDELDGNCTLDRLRQQTWLIAEGLVHMGLVSMYKNFGKPWVRAHHDLYRQFALVMADAMDLKDSFDDTKADWHMAFVTGYFSRKSTNNKEKNDACWDYTVVHLPSHMLKAKMLSTAEMVLEDASFFRARVEALGWRPTIRKYIQDCMALQYGLELHQNKEEPRLSKVFEQLAELVKTMLTKYKGVKDDRERTNEEALSLYSLGFALAENGYHEDALKYLLRASELPSISASLTASIFYATAWCQLYTNKTDQAKQSIEACLVALEKPDIETRKLFAATLAGICEYRSAAIEYKRIVEELRVNSEANATELSTVLWTLGRLYHTMGDASAARRHVEECIRLKSENREVSRSLSGAHSTMGDISIEVGRSSEAKFHYESALKTLDALSCDEQHLDYRLLKAKLQWLREDFVACQELLELVRRTSTDKPLYVLDQSAYDLRCIARIYESGEIMDCIDVLRESLSLTAKRQTSLERANGNIALGNCLVELGDEREALSCFENARETFVEKIGRSVKVVDTTNLIGNVHLSLGNIDKAIEFFEMSNDMIQDVAPDDVERSAGALYLLGEAYETKKDLATAASFYDRCMLKLKRARSHDNPDVAKVLQRLGIVTAAQGNLDVALEYFSQALKIRRSQPGSHLLAETLFSYGVVARKRDQLESAEQSLSEALEITEKVDGKEEEICIMRMELGHVFRLRLMPDEAIDAYSKALEKEIEDKAKEATIRLSLGHAKVSKGQYDDAVANYQSVLSIRNLLFGKDDLKTANASRSLALVKFLIGRVNEALVLLKEFVRVCELPREKSLANPDAALTKLLVGDILAYSGKMDQAKASWNHAKRLCESVTGCRLTTQLHAIIGRRLENGTSYLTLRKNKDAYLEAEKSAFHNLSFVDD